MDLLINFLTYFFINSVFFRAKFMTKSAQKIYNKKFINFINFALKKTELIKNKLKN